MRTNSQIAVAILGWISSQITDGKDVTDIVVTTLTRRRRDKEVLLTDEIWMSSLLRGPWKDEFQILWEDRKRITFQRSDALASLNNIPGFTEKSMLLFRDLRYFGRDMNAQARLNGTGHQFYLGEKYFDERTVAKILDLPMGTSNLKTALEALARRKIERNEGDELCASHDLAPDFETAFGLDWRKVKDSDDLARAMGNLNLGQKKKSTAKQRLIQEG